jgi:hypothetical protein
LKVKDKNTQHFYLYRTQVPYCFYFFI